MSRDKIILRISRLLRICMFMLVTIGIAIVIRRILALTGSITSFNPSGGPAFDIGFGRHPIITLVHILPGLVFMISGPIQFMPDIRKKYINFHRTNGYIFIISAYIVGLSALSMPFIMSPIGGINEAAASILYGGFFLISLSMAWVYIAKKNIILHREWMIRTFAIGLAISTVRPIMGFFFAFSGLKPQVFFGTAFWIGFTLHLIIAEVWINYTRIGYKIIKGE
jgi:uncharacterized membrane protein